MKKVAGLLTLIAVGAIAFAATKGDSIGAKEAPQSSLQEEIQYPPEVKAAMVEAQKAAQDWLKLVDSGKYAESWDKGSEVFRHTITRDQWVTALDQARKRLGGVKSRALTKELPAWNPNGLPPGAYMVVEYNTAFDLATNSGEVLTLRQEPGGEWRVLTYNFN